MAFGCTSVVYPTETVPNRDTPTVDSDTPWLSETADTAGPLQLVPYEVDPWGDDWSVIAPRVRPMAPCTTERARIGDRKFASAQDALDVAQDRDIVALCPGHHEGSLRLPAVASIEVRSVSGDKRDTILVAARPPDDQTDNCSFFNQEANTSVGKLRLSSISFRGCQTATAPSGSLFYFSVHPTSTLEASVSALEFRDLSGLDDNLYLTLASAIPLSSVHIERCKLPWGSLHIAGGATAPMSYVRDTTISPFRVGFFLYNGSSLVVERVAISTVGVTPFAIGTYATQLAQGSAAAAPPSDYAVLLKATTHRRKPTRT